MARPYVPDPPPLGENIEDLKRWMVEQLRYIQDSQAQIHDHVVLHAEPTGKLFNGMQRYADGTDWNPGSGEGLYERRGGAWAKL